MLQNNVKPPSLKLQKLKLAISLPIRLYAMHSKRGHRIVRSAHFIRTRSNYSSWLRADFCILRSSRRSFGDCISTYCVSARARASLQSSPPKLDWKPIQQKHWRFFHLRTRAKATKLKKQSKNCNWKEALHKVDLHEVVKRAEIPFLCALDGVHSGVAK